MTYVERRYVEFIDKHGYAPEYFNAYFSKEIIDIAPTLTTECGNPGGSGSITIVECVTQKG